MKSYEVSAHENFSQFIEIPDALISPTLFHYIRNCNFLQATQINLGHTENAALSKKMGMQRNLKRQKSIPKHLNILGDESLQQKCCLQNQKKKEIPYASYEEDYSADDVE